MLMTDSSVACRDFSYLKRFMMRAMSLGMPLQLSLHVFSMRHDDDEICTFALKNDTGQESWPMFLRNRTDAMLRAQEFLKQYNCKIDSDPDIDEQYVQFTFNS